MQGDDILEIGHSKLVLIPFAGEKYSWSRELATLEMETSEGEAS
jgi:hypothetical protein